MIEGVSGHIELGRFGECEGRSITPRAHIGGYTHFAVSLVMNALSRTRAAGEPRAASRPSASLYRQTERNLRRKR